MKYNLIILLPYFVFLITAIIIIYTFKKTEVHLFFNGLVGNSFFDKFYYYLTYLGDGNFAIFFLALVFCFNIHIGIYSTASFLIASLASVLLKHFAFDDVNRPFFIFTYYEHYQLRLVEGVHVYIHNSFPSGHATQAFSIFMSLAFCTKNKLIKLTWLVVALLSAFSRVYLSQHWLNDVTAGSFIGTIFAILFYFSIYRTPKMKLIKKNIFETSFA